MRICAFGKTLVSTESIRQNGETLAELEQKLVMLSNVFSITIHGNTQGKNNNIKCINNIKCNKLNKACARGKNRKYTQKTF